MPSKNTRTTTDKQSQARVNRDVAHPNSKAWKAHDQARDALNRRHQARLIKLEAEPIANANATWEASFRDSLQAWARRSG